jgi:hypothetical protein
MQSGHVQTNGSSNERRNHASPRVPIDLLVELRGADERAAKHRVNAEVDDAYDADALDVSATGLRMRSSVLPDVGQRLRCRLELPETEAPFEAEGEVVWSSDEGEHQGEFGLRFDAMGKGTTEMLKHWTMHRGGPRTLPGEDEARAFRSLGPARVSLEGVASAMECDVVRRDETCLDVMQALPFLELGKLAEVFADGSSDRRRLEHVSLRVIDGVPHLVLSLIAEASSAGELLAPSMDDEAPGADSTLQDQALDELLAQRAVRTREREERVVAPARVARIETKSESAWVTEEAPPSDEIEARDAREDDGGESEESAQADAPVEAPSKRVHSKRELFHGDESSADVGIVTHRKKKLDEVRRVLLDGEELPESDEEVASSEGTALEMFKARATAMRESMAPAFARMTTALRTGWAAFVAGVGPRAKASWTAFSEWIARVATTVSEQLKTRAPKLASMFTRGAKEKRRTTVAPAQTREATQARRATRGANGAVVERVKAQPAAAASTRPAVPLRYVLAGVVALGAVGALAYAFGTGSDEPAPIEVPVVAPAALTAEPEMTPEALPAAPSVASTPTPVVAAAATATAHTEPSAMPAASTDEGRLPLPGYPSIGRAPTESATSATSTPSAPARAPVIGRNFGAEHVEDGRTTTLQMTLVPSALEGQADPNGFTVTVRGALSETRAAQIARTNPAVDRASIINRGDHCVLDVRFVEGRTPAYRVAIVNQTVEVTIGH